MLIFLNWAGSVVHLWSWVWSPSPIVRHRAGFYQSSLLAMPPHPELSQSWVMGSRLHLEGPSWHEIWAQPPLGDKPCCSPGTLVLTTMRGTSVQSPDLWFSPCCSGLGLWQELCSCWGCPGHCSSPVPSAGSPLISWCYSWYRYIFFWMEIMLSGSSVLPLLAGRENNCLSQFPAPGLVSMVPQGELLGFEVQCPHSANICLLPSGSSPFQGQPLPSCPRR